MAISDAVEVGLKLIDKWFQSPAQKDAAKMDLLKMDQAGEFKVMDLLAESDKNQANINAVEASSESLFKSGWRPAIGWTCAGGLFYQLIFRPLGMWIASNAFGWQVPPPSLEIETLMTLLFGMLGLGGYRTYEKVKLK